MIEKRTAAGFGRTGSSEERASILIVDDRHDKRLVFSTILDELGEEVVTAQSGEEALRWLLENDCAVILLDVNMPGMDGLETAELIRSRRKSAHTPIIFITAFADEIHTAKGYSLGAVDYILSPVMPNVLRSKVRALVQLYKLNLELRRRADERVALAREQAARSVAEQSQRRAAFLAELGHVMGKSLNASAILEGACNLAVPFLADYCTFAIAERFGMERATCYAASSAWAALPHCQGPAFETWRRKVEEDVLTAGERRMLPCGGETSLGDGGTVAAFPLTTRGECIGVLVLGRCGSEGTFNHDDISLAENVAERVAGALDNSLLYTRLQDADRRKTEFLATLSHELRNPLAPLRNALRTLRMIGQSDPGQLAQLSDMMDRQVTHMTRLVEDLLDVSRITSGNIELRKQYLDLRKELGHVLESCQSRITEAQHVVVLKCPEQSLVVEADQARLHQMLENLIINAVKYTDPGGRIDISAAAEGGEVVIRVRDNGIGISAEQMPHIWGLFVQVDPSQERVRRGLGIGLALVTDLVMRHGGKVEAYSEGLGKGSEFALRLPRVSQTSVPAPATAPPARYSPVSPDKALRVLVVDDNVDAADSFSLMLRLLGEETAVAHDGSVSLQVAESFMPDLVFLDISLPGLLGTEVARRLRAHPELRSAYLIALSGYGTDEDRQKSMAAGFDEHRTKPLDPDLLPGILETARARKAQHVATSNA
jgi:signal transduction histidine kinase/DNA-binding response OmpR family regulator